MDYLGVGICENFSHGTLCLSLYNVNLHADHKHLRGSRHPLCFTWPCGCGYRFWEAGRVESLRVMWASDTVSTVFGWFVCGAQGKGRRRAIPRQPWPRGATSWVFPGEVGFTRKLSAAPSTMVFPPPGGQRLTWCRTWDFHNTLYY